MIDPLHYRRDYDNAPKFRCVARATIIPESVRERVKARYFQRAAISDEAFERYWRDRRPVSPEEPTDHTLIRENFRYLFTRAVPPFKPGRFNRETYAALYTARDTDTAKAERFHYLPKEASGFEYVVYSMSISAEVADLRPWQDQEKIILDDSHVACRPIADAVRSHVSGIAWYSVRYEGGACCAFFSVEGVQPLEILEEGMRNIAERKG